MVLAVVASAKIALPIVQLEPVYVVGVEPFRCLVDYPMKQEGFPIYRSIGIPEGMQSPLELVERRQHFRIHHRKSSISQMYDANVVHLLNGNGGRLTLKLLIRPPELDFETMGPDLKKGLCLAMSRC